MHRELNHNFIAVQQFMNLMPCSFIVAGRVSSLNTFTLLPSEEFWEIIVSG